MIRRLMTRCCGSRTTTSTLLSRSKIGPCGNCRKWLSRLPDSAQNQFQESETQSTALYRCPCSPPMCCVSQFFGNWSRLDCSASSNRAMKSTRPALGTQSDETWGSTDSERERSRAFGAAHISLPSIQIREWNCPQAPNCWPSNISSACSVPRTLQAFCQQAR
jgi:hypothetical protein